MARRYDQPSVGSLFAGIGGLDLGFERAGFRIRWQVENDPYANRVLDSHWPDVRRYGDIRSIDWSTVEPVDVVMGGFPCQPVSIAGRKAAQTDDRWLWPEFGRAIGALRPAVVVVENVPNILVVNGGRAFGDVVGDLAARGYDALWDCIPAASVGANHRRDRLFILGVRQWDDAPVTSCPDCGEPWCDRHDDHWSDCECIGWAEWDDRLADGSGSELSDVASGAGSEFGRTVADADSDDARSSDPVRARRHAVGDGGPDVADADGARSAHAGQGDAWEGIVGSGTGMDTAAAGSGGARAMADGVSTGLEGHAGYGASASGWPIQDGPIGAAGVRPRRPRWWFDWWDVEPGLGRMADGIPNRMDRLRVIGNAVVPQVAEVVAWDVLQLLRQMDDG